MIFNQTVENHEDLLKVVDNMLSEVGVSRSELKGEVTFAGLDPIRPTVLKVGAAGAAVIGVRPIRLKVRPETLMKFKRICSRSSQIA
jgi:hypothetical protein